MIWKFDEYGDPLDHEKFCRELSEKYKNEGNLKASQSLAIAAEKFYETHCAIIRLDELPKDINLQKESNKLFKIISIVAIFALLFVLIVKYYYEN